MSRTFHGIQVISLEDIDGTLTNLEVEIIVNGQSEYMQTEAEGPCDVELTQAMLDDQLSDEDLELLQQWLTDIKNARK